jgi:hypothetical protein
MKALWNLTTAHRPLHLKCSRSTRSILALGLKKNHALREILNALELAPKGHWDELRGGRQHHPGEGTDSIFGAVLESTQVTPHWAHFLSQLGAEGLQGLPHRHETMVRQIRDNGMTYTSMPMRINRSALGHSIYCP